MNPLHPRETPLTSLQPSLRGFTMIELTLVGLVIMILIAIAVPNFLEATIRAKMTRCVTDLALLGSALEEYYVEHRAYPPNTWRPNEDLSPSGEDDAKLRIVALHTLTTPIRYLSKLPADPFPRGEEMEDSYDYFNFVDWTGAAVAKWEMVVSEEGSAAYLVLGGGPDRSLDFESRSFPPTGTPYSPTNGTRSHGDILFFGPQ